MEKTKISKIIIILIGIVIIYGSLFLIANWLDKEIGCHCQYDIYLPTDYCWGHCYYF